MELMPTTKKPITISTVPSVFMAPQLSFAWASCHALAQCFRLGTSPDALMRSQPGSKKNECHHAAARQSSSPSDLFSVGHVERVELSVDASSE